MHVVVLGHGSRDPRHAQLIDSVAAALNERSLRATVGSAYLDLCPPTLPEAVADVDDDSVIVVPMLLTAAFHASVDVPAAVDAARAARPDVNFLVADVLGPSPLLIAAMERRVREAGADLDAPDTAVLFVAAGSSDANARATIAGVANDWLAPPRRGAHAFITDDEGGIADTICDLVSDSTRRLVVAPYLLGEGVLPDRAFEEARRIGAELGVEVVIAGVIGDAPELLDLVPERARNAAS